MGAEPVFIRGSETDINAEETWAVNRAWTIILTMTEDAQEFIRTLEQTRERMTDDEARQIQDLHIQDARWGDKEVTETQAEDGPGERPTAKQRDNRKRKATHQTQQSAHMGGGGRIICDETGQEERGDQTSSRSQVN